MTLSDGGGGCGGGSDVHWSVAHLRSDGARTWHRIVRTAMLIQSLRLLWWGEEGGEGVEGRLGHGREGGCRVAVIPGRRVWVRRLKAAWGDKGRALHAWG